PRLVRRTQQSGSEEGRAVTEGAYVKELSRLVQDCGNAGVSSSAMAVVEEAVAALPESARLWWLRGGMIQVGSEGIDYTLTDARMSYERALQVAPDNPEALESLGYFFDAVEPDAVAAERYFRRAIECGGGKTAFIGLAELYVEQGRISEAIAV